MIVDRYYYGRLSENEKKIYREIYAGCMEHKDVIPISGLSNELTKSYDRIVSALTDDNPLLYYVNQTVMDIAKDGFGNYAVIPQYFFTKEKVESYNSKIQNAANQLIQSLKLTECSPSEKVKRVHDYMCEHVKYDYGGTDLNDVSRFIVTHNIIGVFAHKKAQCEGIAKAAKVLLNAVDVPCIFVGGKALDEKGIMGDHGWNIVKIDGKAYHVDITFDIGLSKEKHISYDYFNVPDTMISRNHTFDKTLPKCSSDDKSYFKQQQLFFTAKGKILAFLEKRAKKGETLFYLQLGGRLKAAEMADELLNCVYAILCEKGKGNLKAHRVVNEFVNTIWFYFG